MNQDDILKRAHAEDAMNRASRIAALIEGGMTPSSAEKVEDTASHAARSAMETAHDIVMRNRTILNLGGEESLIAHIFAMKMLAVSSEYMAHQLGQIAAGALAEIQAERG